MKKSLLAALCLASAVTMSANSRLAIMIDGATVDDLDFQEAAAAKVFTDLHKDGTIIAKGETSKIDAKNLDCIWIHFDRCGLAKGDIPAAFGSQETIDALAKFVADGGNLYLSKQATQLVAKIGRIPANLDVTIYDNGDGGLGTDNWEIMAIVGYDFLNEGQDNSLCFDQRNHAIYAGLESSERDNHHVFPLLGTNGNGEMWRENHNCKWDFNAYQYTVEGATNLVKFQNETNSVVLGMWGHVKDHACAGIIEFLPQNESRSTAKAGTILANGLAAYEFAPRQGTNAWTENIKRLTANSLDYLAKGTTTSAGIVAADEEAAPEYYNLQGMKVSADNLAAGIYIVRRGNNTSKVIVK